MTTPLPHMRAAFTALLQADPTIDQDKAKRLLAIYDGTNEGSGLSPIDFDRVVPFSEAATIVRRDQRTLRNWARRGALRFIYGAGRRAIGVSAASLRDFMLRTNGAIFDNSCKFKGR